MLVLTMCIVGLLKYSYMLIPAKHNWLSQLPSGLPELGKSVFVMFVSPYRDGGTSAGTGSSTAVVLPGSYPSMACEVIGPTGEKMTTPAPAMAPNANPFGMGVGMGMPMMGMGMPMMGMGMGYPMMNPMFMPGERKVCWLSSSKDTANSAVVV